MRSINHSKYVKRVIGVFAICVIFISGIFAANRLGLLRGGDVYQTERKNNARYIKAPKVGDVCQVGISDGLKSATTKYTWFKILKVDEVNNKIVIAPHIKELISLDNLNELLLTADSFKTKSPETFILKEFHYHNFQKENEDRDIIIRNVYNIKRPAK